MNLEPLASHPSQNSHHLLHETFPGIIYVPSHMTRPGCTRKSIRSLPLLSMPPVKPVFRTTQFSPKFFHRPPGGSLHVIHLTFFKVTCLPGPHRINAIPLRTPQSLLTPTLLPHPGPSDPHTPAAPLQGDPKHGQPLTPLVLCTCSSLFLDCPSTVFTWNPSIHPSKPRPTTSSSRESLLTSPDNYPSFKVPGDSTLNSLIALSPLCVHLCLV